MVITIDGPAGAGKSTVARLLAVRLGFEYLDTGAMYRAVAWLALREGLLDDVDSLCRRLDKIQLHIAGATVTIDGLDATPFLRDPEVTRASTRVAAHPAVRVFLVRLQKKLGESGRIVTEGRDQGTDVFPQACCKFYLTAEPGERARRRLAELTASGVSPLPTLAELEASIADRDNRDATRPTGALRAALDAKLVDTTALSTDQVVELLEREARIGLAAVGAP